MKVKDIENYELNTIIKKNYKFVDDDKFLNYIKSLNLFAIDNDHNQKILNWQTHVSGSKCKNIIKDPIGTLLYYLGFYNEYILNEELYKINRMSWFATYGTLFEEPSGAIFADMVNQINNPDELRTFNYKDVFGGSKPQTEIIQFENNFRDRQVLFFKDTMYIKNKLQSLNVDGLIFDKNDNLEYILEIKTKKDEITLVELMDLHTEQLMYYKSKLKPSKGIVLLYLKGNRGYGVKIFTNEDLDNNLKLSSDMKKVEIFTTSLELFFSYVIKPSNYSDNIFKDYDYKQKSNILRNEKIENITNLFTKIVKVLLSWYNLSEKNSIDLLIKHIKNLNTFNSPLKNLDYIDNIYLMFVIDIIKVELDKYIQKNLTNKEINGG